MSEPHARLLDMSALASALAYQRLFDDSATTALLRARTAPVVAALLQEHLGSPGSRRDTEEVHELIDADLPELRDHFQLGGMTAKAYCDAWREAGYIIRRPTPDARAETYELSAATLEAIQLLNTLNQPASVATESRLVSLTNAIHQLAVDTDPDTQSRIAALTEQRDRLNTEIEQLQRGVVPDPMAPDRALERIGDILQQASVLPSDFARVRARFEELNQELRASLVSSDEVPSELIEDIFRGVDLIESSDEGRTFSAFSSLLRDPEMSEQFDDDVASLLKRSFANSLVLEQRQSLRRIRRNMAEQSRDVQQTLTDFARSLRRYVYSQDYHHDRVLRSLLNETLSAALSLDATQRRVAEGTDLEVPRVSIRSVGAAVPFDPREHDPGEPLEEEPPRAADMGALHDLARRTEIDFDELVHNVNAVIDTLEEQAQPSEATTPATTPTVSIRAILEHFPATQGLASVVGLLSLAAKHGQVDHETTEILEWSGSDGPQRRASTTRHTFARRI